MTQNKIRLYPNPATGHLIVSINKPVANALLEIWSRNGRLLQVHPIRNAVETISLKNRAVGVYYVQVRNGAVRMSTKVVKQ